MADRIVVLDGYTLNPGDLSWQSFETLGTVEVHDRSNRAQTLERAAGATVALTNKTILDEAIIKALPELKYIGVLATGVNVVDLDAAKANDVVVTNVPGYGVPSVAQHTFALLLDLTNHVAAHSDAVRGGQWSSCDDFCFALSPLVELQGKTLGVIGMGAIGQNVARIGTAMGMNIASLDRPGRPRKQVPGVDIDWLGLDELIATSDVVTLHCPLTEETKHLINTDRLRQMKSTAYLLNTGRGPLIDESALATALTDGQIAGAGLDVLSVEPPADEHAKNPLLSAPNCVITPHNAWASKEARTRLMELAAGNLSAFLKGESLNVVNP